MNSLDCDTSLPWQKPKSILEDPRALEELDTILRNPSYILPEKDSEFIATGEVRGVRLQLDYLKAEIKMEQYGIENTIVVFGSARIIEKQTAMERLRILGDMTEAKSKCLNLAEEIRITKTMVEKSRYYDEARRFGQLVGSSGKGPDDCRVTIMTGGGPGIMEAANRGAFDVGAKSIGLNIQLPHEQFPNPYITPDLCFQFHYFSMRKLHFMHRAKALVVFPGGFGTMDELFEMLTLIQTRKNPPIPIVLVCHTYWSQAVNFDFLIDEGVITPHDRELFSFAENADEAWEMVQEWYRSRGNPLVS